MHKVTVCMEQLWLPTWLREGRRGGNVQRIPLKKKNH